jgi:Uncharacterised nucleotidyltransferase
MPLKLSPQEQLVDFMSFPNSRIESLRSFSNFSNRKWTRLLSWLDDTGLALYFLRKLEDTHASNTLPESAMSYLKCNFAANQMRVRDMLARFDVLNQQFCKADVRYSVLKGFSLVPRFCSDPCLRHQCDLDYLIDERSLYAAQRVLLESGYKPKEQTKRDDFVFLWPEEELPKRSAEQYQAQASHSVELHLDMWDSDSHGLPLLRGLFSVERSETRVSNGLRFPALKEEDAFLLQVLHACGHLFGYWIRLSLLFEIGYFINERHSDTAFWKSIDCRIGNNVVLREFVVIVSELVHKLFVPPLPDLVRAWQPLLRPGARVWIDNYAWNWLFGKLPGYQFCLFPRTKFVLFLQQQYRGDMVPAHIVRKRMMPIARLWRIASVLWREPSLLLNRNWWKHNFFIRRILFHVLAGLRYLCEIPRWRLRNRLAVRSGSLDV